MNFSENFLAGLGRLMLAALFLQSGFYRLLTPAEAQEAISASGLPQAHIIYWISVGIEMIGGLMLALGLMRRLAAFVLAVFIICSALVLHTHFSDTAEVTQFMKNDQFVHFIKNLAIAGGLLQIASGVGASRNRA